MVQYATPELIAKAKQKGYWVQLDDGRVGIITRFLPMNYVGIDVYDGGSQTVRRSQVKFIYLNKSEAISDYEKLKSAGIDVPSNSYTKLKGVASQPKPEYAGVPFVPGVVKVKSPMDITAGSEAQQKAEQIAQQREAFERETAQRSFESLSPTQRFTLAQSTVLSPRGYEFVGSLLTSPFDKGKQVREVLIKQVRAQQKATMEGKEFEFAIESGIDNPAIEVESFLLGGELIGVASRTIKGAKFLRFVETPAKAVLGTSIGYEIGTAVREPTPYNIGRATVTGASIFGMGKAIKYGEKAGFQIFEVPREVKVLETTGKLAKIGKNVVNVKITEEEGKIIKQGVSKIFNVGSKTPYLRQAEQVVITRGGRFGIERVPRKERILALKELSRQKARIFGSFSQEMQFPREKARAVKDIDVILGKESGKYGLAESIGGKVVPVYKKGKLVRKDIKFGAFDVDVKVKGTIEEKGFGKFLFKQKEFKQKGIKFTAFSEQFGRKLSGSIDPERIFKKKGQEIEDVRRITRLLIEEKAAAGKKLSKGELEFLKIKPRKVKARRTGTSESIFGDESYFGAKRKQPSSIFYRTSRPSGSFIRKPKRSSLFAASLTFSPSGSRPGRRPQEKPFLSRIPSRKPTRYSLFRSSTTPGSSLVLPPSEPPPSRPTPSPFSLARTTTRRRPKIKKSSEAKKTKGKKKTSKRAYRYTPSVYAGIFGIRSRKKPKRTTGLEIRPIVR